MALYQLMKTYSDGSVGQSGKTHKQLNRLKTRLAKEKQGYINQLTAKGKVVISAKGYSRQAMEAMGSFGVIV